MIDYVLMSRENFRIIFLYSLFWFIQIRQLQTFSFNDSFSTIYTLYSDLINIIEKFLWK